jgi:hypothetical protein
MHPAQWLAHALDMDVGIVEWLSAYGFTQLVELPIYERALRRRPRAERLWLALAPSALTHPFVWFAFPQLPVPYLTMVVLAEAFAFGVEWALLRALGVPRAWLWSLAANALSLGLALISRSIFDWP